MIDDLRVLVISGSLRAHSYTRALAEGISATLRDTGAAVEHWSLRHRPLEMVDPDARADPGSERDTETASLLRAASGCDAFVLASPVYHNSYSGVLKNALDHLDVDHFSYKAVGLAGHGGNRSTQAVDHLRIVVRGLRGVAIPSQLCTADVDFDWTSEGSLQLCDRQLLVRQRNFVTELVVLAHHLRVLRQSLTQPAMPDPFAVEEAANA